MKTPGQRKSIRERRHFRGSRNFQGGHKTIPVKSGLDRRASISCEREMLLTYRLKQRAEKPLRRSMNTMRHIANAAMKHIKDVTGHCTSHSPLSRHPASQTTCLNHLDRETEGLPAPAAERRGKMRLRSQWLRCHQEAHKKLLRGPAELCGAVTRLLIWKCSRAGWRQLWKLERRVKSRLVVQLSFSPLSFYSWIYSWTLGPCISLAS